MENNLTCNQSEFFKAGIGFRRVKPNGESIHGHKHNIDHATIVIRGPVCVTKWCACDPSTIIVEEYTDGDVCEVKADWFHKLESPNLDAEYLCAYPSPDSKSLEDAIYDMAEAKS